MGLQGTENLEKDLESNLEEKLRLKENGEG